MPVRSQKKSHSPRVGKTSNTAAHASRLTRGKDGIFVGCTMPRLQFRSLEWRGLLVGNIRSGEQSSPISREVFSMA